MTSTTPLLVELSEEDFTEIQRIAKAYIRDAKRCKQGKAYIAGCVMAGAALEALLCLMVACYIDEVNLLLHNGSNYMQKLQKKDLHNWTLENFLLVAKKIGWLPYTLEAGINGQSRDHWNSKKARIGDYSEIVRIMRNCVHPKSYMKEHRHKRFTANHLDHALEIVSCIEDHLYHSHLAPSIIEALQDEYE